MVDWSDLFEKRLQTVLADSMDQEPKRVTPTAALLARTPPWTAHQQQEQRRTTMDPTAAFFNTLRRTQISSSNASGSSSGASASQRQSRIALSQLMTPSMSSGIGAATPGPTPGPTPVSNVGRPLVQGLQASYAKRARDLHGAAQARLAAVQQALERQLADLGHDEDGVVAAVEAAQASFDQPPASWTVTIQVRDKTGCVVQQDERIVDRVATLRTAAATLEDDLARLWQEWRDAQTELADVLVSFSDNPRSDRTSPDDSSGLDPILADAERDMAAAAADAVRAMRSNEKTFRKLILAEECKLAQTVLARQSKYD